MHKFSPMCSCGLGASIHIPSLCKRLSVNDSSHRRSSVVYLDQNRDYYYNAKLPYDQSRSAALNQLSSLPLHQLELLAIRSVLRPGSGSGNAGRDGGGGDADGDERRR